MASAYLRSFTDRMYSSIPVAYGTATDKEKNDLIVVENQVGFFIEDGPTTAEVAAGATRDTMIVTEAQKAVFPVSTSLAIAVGDDVFYDAVAEEIVLDSTERSVGYCIKECETADATVWIRFHQEAVGGTY